MSQSFTEYVVMRSPLTEEQAAELLRLFPGKAAAQRKKIVRLACEGWAFRKIVEILKGSRE